LKDRLPGGASGKELACQFRRYIRERCGFDSLVGKIPLEEGVAADSSILTWIIPWTKEPGRLHSIGSQRFGYN